MEGLQQGDIWMDASGSVALKVVELLENTAKITVEEVIDEQIRQALRNEKRFTDGRTKCFGETQDYKDVSPRKCVGIDEKNNRDCLTYCGNSETLCTRTKLVKI